MIRQVLVVTAFLIIVLALVIGATHLLTNDGEACESEGKSDVIVCVPGSGPGAR